MRAIFSILFLLMSVVLGDAAARKVLQIDISSNPSNNDTLVINGATRTWKTSVTNPATEIGIGASAAASKTKLFLQIAANPYTGPLILQSVDSDSIKLTTQVDGALTYSQTGSWATFTLTSLTVTSAYNVRMPITVEPSATRTTIANDLVSAISLATGTFGTSDAAFGNFASLTGTQTVQNKSLQTGNIDSLTIRNGSTNNDTTIETTAYQGIHFNNYNNGARKFTIRPNNNGYPSIFDTSSSATANTNVTASDSDLSSNAAALLNVGSADNRYLRINGGGTITANVTISGDLTSTGAATFSNITGSTINGSTIATASSIGGTIGALTGGTITSSTITTPTLTGAVTINSTGHLITKRYDDTGVTSGNATLDPYSAGFVKLTGLTGDVFLVGISGGADGRILRVYNPSETYNVDVYHESSLESTAAQRIRTNTESNKVGASGTQMMTFIYDAGASRWILMSFES